MAAVDLYAKRFGAVRVDAIRACEAHVKADKVASSTKPDPDNGKKRMPTELAKQRAAEAKQATADYKVSWNEFQTEAVSVIRKFDVSALPPHVRELADSVQESVLADLVEFEYANELSTNPSTRQRALGMYEELDSGTRGKRRWARIDRLRAACATSASVNQSPQISREEAARLLGMKKPEHLRYFAWSEYHHTADGPFGGEPTQLVQIVLMEAWADSATNAVIFWEGRVVGVSRDFTVTGTYTVQRTPNQR